MKKFSTKVMFMMVLVLSLFCISVLVTAPADAAWKPVKPIILLVGNNPGGGADLFARAIHRAITENKLCEQPVVVQNMAGGAFAVAYAYMRAQADPYIIAVTSGSYFTLPLTVDPAPVQFSDFAPVAHLVNDPNMVVVPKNSPFNSLQDIIDFAKKNPGKLKFAGSNPFSADRLLMEQLNEEAGIEIVYVPFQAGSDILAAVLGSHIDMAAFGPSEAAEHFKNGDMKPIAVATKERFPEIPDVPTFIELGYPIDHMQSRTIIMERKCATPEILEYYSDLMRRVSETKTWQDWVAAEGMTSNFMDYKTYEKAHDEIVEFHVRHINSIKARQK